MRFQRLFEQTTLFIEEVVLFINPILYLLVASMIIIFIGFILGKLIGAFVLRILKDARFDVRSRNVLSTSKPSERISKIVSLIIYSASVIIALFFLGVLYLTILLVALCFLAVLLFSSVFFIRDFLPNLFAWFSLRKKLFVGEKAIINKELGVVVKQSLVETHLRLRNGDLLVFPNRIITAKRA